MQKKNLFKMLIEHIQKSSKLVRIFLFQIITKEIIYLRCWFDGMVHGNDWYGFFET